MTDSMYMPREGESKTPLTHAVPPSLTYRAAEYTSLPSDAAAWMHRHRDQPSIFRRAIYLFSRYQTLQIGELFPPGWKVDPGHSLLSCVGTLRFEQAHTKEGAAGASPSVLLFPVRARRHMQPALSRMSAARLSPHCSCFSRSALLSASLC
jgi:hypothetical protein